MDACSSRLRSIPRSRALDERQLPPRRSPQPGHSAATVVELMENGKPAARLVAMELLEAWNAPVTGLDPWQPETITAERISALKKWSAHLHATPSTTRATAVSANL